MKVAIWASCNYGNYGDDIMSIMIAETVKRGGATPYVYRLNSRIAELYEINSSQTLNDLLYDARFALIGGGSWLETRRLGKNFELDFENLVLHLEKYNCPIYAISIGGDKSQDINRLEPMRKKLLSHRLFKEATVRLKENVDLLNRLGKNALYAPDIVLLVSKFWKNTDAAHKVVSKQIGINLHRGGKKFIPILKFLFQFFYPKYKLIFIKTHAPEYDLNYEYQTVVKGEKMRNLTYDEPSKFINAISNLDVILSFKLHPGVTALSFGIPFYSIGSFDKTRSFIKSTIGSEFILKRRKLLIYILTRKIVSQLDIHNSEIIEKQIIEAEFHLEYVKNLIIKFKNNVG